MLRIASQDEAFGEGIAGRRPREAIGTFRFGRRRGPKTAKAKRIFRQAKRIVSQRGSKSLKSLCALNQSFRGIVCFQWVNCLFVSPFSRHSRSRPEIPVRRIARRLVEATRRIRVFDGSEHDNTFFSKREDISYLLTYRVSEPVSKPLSDKSRSTFLRPSITSSKNAHNLLARYTLSGANRRSLNDFLEHRTLVGRECAFSGTEGKVSPPSSKPKRRRATAAPRRAAACYRDRKRRILLPDFTPGRRT
jgi:hypothetical protein